MKGTILLINPFNSIVPRKMLQEVVQNCADDFNIIEFNKSRYNFTKIASQVQDGFAIWFFGRMGQMPQHVGAMKQFVETFQQRGFSTLLIVPEATVRYHSDLKMMLIEDGISALKEFIVQHFNLVLSSSKNAKKINEANFNIREALLGTTVMAKQLKKGSKGANTAIANSTQDEQQDEVKHYFELWQRDGIMPEDDLGKSLRVITHPDECMQAICDLCENAPVLNFWTEKDTSECRSILRSGPEEGQCTFFLHEKRSRIFLKKRIEANPNLNIFCRGNLSDSGVFFVVKNVGQCFNGEKLITSIPEEFWKVERRKEHRLRFYNSERMDVEFYLDEVRKTLVHRTLLGLSSDGMLMALHKDDKDLFAPGKQVFQIRFQLNGKFIECNGLVKWVRNVNFKYIGRKQVFQAGIQFMDLSSDHLRLIGSFLKIKLYDKERGG